MAYVELQSRRAFPLTAALAGFVEQVRARRARAAQFRALARTDDATLRDIGMTRAELVSVCYGDPRGRRRSDV